MICEMQAELPPCTITSDAPVSRIAVCILAGGTIGLGVIAAVVCGFACYNDIGGTDFDDIIAISLMHGGPLLLRNYSAACGIGGMIPVLAYDSKAARMVSSGW